MHLKSGYIIISKTTTSKELHYYEVSEIAKVRSYFVMFSDFLIFPIYRLST